MYATRLSGAGVVGARIVVVTVRGSSSLTNPAGTGITDGAGIAIVAGHRVVGIYASGVGVATVCCAKFVVVAIGRRAGQTPAFLALVVQTAFATVVTRLLIRLKVTTREGFAGIVGTWI